MRHIPKPGRLPLQRQTIRQLDRRALVTVTGGDSVPPAPPNTKHPEPMPNPW